MGANLSYPVVDLGGKVALVTGANTGLGYETAKVLAGMGAHTFVTCRSQEKAAAVSTVTSEYLKLLLSVIYTKYGEKPVIHEVTCSELART